MEKRVDDWIDGYLQYTDNSEPPTMYKRWVAISCIAACLQRKCFLEWGELTFFPNMYVVLVGPSGKCRKGTAMGVGARFLREIGIDLAAEAITREALIRELKESTEQSIDTKTGDVEYHASLTIYSQELTVFLGYNNLQLISDITDWYDCRERWTYRTKNMGTDEIVGVWVNLIGATTPDLVRSALPQDAVGGGLSSRIIFVYEEEKSKSVAAPFLTSEDQALSEKLSHDLEDIYTMRGKFRITDDFLEKWIKWYEKQEGNPPFNLEQFQGYIHRRPNHILKLCMILSASSRTDMVITADILDRAIDILTKTERKMPQTFAGYGKASTAELVSKLMAIIGTEGEIKKDELLRRQHHNIENLEHLDNALATLVKMGYCAYNYETGIIKHNKKSDVGQYFRE